MLQSPSEATNADEADGDHDREAATDDSGTPAPDGGPKAKGDLLYFLTKTKKPNPKSQRVLTPD